MSAENYYWIEVIKIVTFLHDPWFLSCKEIKNDEKIMIQNDFERNLATN